MGKFEIDTKNFNNRREIFASIGNAWIYLYDNENECDLELVGLLGGECDTPFNMYHFKNGNYLFFKGYGVPLCGNVYLVLKDGRIFELIFVNGDLIYASRMKDKCILGNLLIPSFDEIDIRKTIIEENSAKFYTKEKKLVFELFGDEKEIYLRNEYKNEISYVHANINDFKLGVDFENEEGKLDIDGLNYYFDGSIAWYMPNENKNRINEEEKVIFKNDALFKDVSIDEISEIEQFLNVHKI